MTAKERDQLLTEFFNSYKGGAGGNPYFRSNFELELKAVSAKERTKMAKNLVAELAQENVEAS